jgi:hypothetical protein
MIKFGYTILYVKDVLQAVTFYELPYCLTTAITLSISERNWRRCIPR